VFVLQILYKCHKRFAQRRMELFDDLWSRWPFQKTLAEAVRAMLQEHLYLSCKRLSTHFRLAKAACLHILYHVLLLKSSIYTEFRALLIVIKSRTDGTFFGTIRSSDKIHIARIWLCYNRRRAMVLFQNLHAAIWTPSRDVIPERIRQTIDTDSYLISIIRSVNGISNLLNGSKGIVYHRPFFCDSVVLGLVQITCAYSRRMTLKGIMMHLDNAGPHNVR
jgi:hypothetical protein